METTRLMHPRIEDAYACLDRGEPITRELAYALAEGVHGAGILDLVSLANKVRRRYAAAVESCSIANVRSGLCGENCRFCAQSLHHSCAVDRYALTAEDDIVAQARTAHDAGATHFGLVTSGKGYRRPTAEFEAICRAINRIRAELPSLNVCASLGMLSEENVIMLAACDVAHYNINLQVSPRRYAELIADTHTAEDRIETIRLLRKHGIKVCCGAIFGVGETMADRVDLAFELHALDVSVIPLNALIPIAGTPLEGTTPLTAAELAKSFALFRLIHPRKTIKFAAGRETLMKDFQGLLMLAGVNGLLTGGYLTTRGRETAEDRIFVNQLSGFDS